MEGKNTMARVNAAMRNPIIKPSYRERDLIQHPFYDLDRILQESEQAFAKSVAGKVYEHQEQLP